MAILKFFKIKKPYYQSVHSNIFGSKAVFSRVYKDPLLCVPRLLGVCHCRDV